MLAANKGIWNLLLTPRFPIFTSKRSDPIFPPSFFNGRRSLWHFIKWHFFLFSSFSVCTANCTTRSRHILQYIYTTKRFTFLVCNCLFTFGTQVLDYTAAHAYLSNCQNVNNGKPSIRIQRTRNNVHNAAFYSIVIRIKDYLPLRRIRQL